MAVIANRLVTINMSGDVLFAEGFAAAQNNGSPGVITVGNLIPTNNVVPIPSAATTCECITIIPPPGNPTQITLKGTSADTGILMHKTNPTCLAVDTTVGQFVLAVTTTIIGVRYIFT